MQIAEYTFNAAAEDNLLRCGIQSASFLHAAASAPSVEQEIMVQIFKNVWVLFRCGH